MPRAKDYVSVGYKVHKQKHLLLSNLKELHVAYKQKFPHQKIGLPKFCELRLKWCVTVSSSGTHSVCVSTIHQNTKLLIEELSTIINNYLKQREKEKEEEVHIATDTVTEAEKFTLTYKDLMKMIVCDTEQLECIVHRCENCPGFQVLQTFFENKFTEMDIDGNVSYSQWESNDRTSLRTNTWNVDKFIELLVYSVDNLTTHSFIAKSQARYLKLRKANINRDLSKQF